MKKIKKMFFSNEFQPKYPLTLCYEHQHFLEYISYPSPLRIPMPCRKVEKDHEDHEDLEELRLLSFKESTEKREVKDTISVDTRSYYAQPLNLRKVNIGSEEHPRMESIGDYQDGKTITKIQAMLQEYEYLFPKKFSELKGIKGDLGEMKIVLKPNFKLVKHRPYHLNPRVKEKVKKEINIILTNGLIFPVDEVEWIIPISIQSKKGIGDIRVCVDYKILNATCVHDPFTTPFSDEVLDQVEGNEYCSFTEGFSGYHQVRIAKEEKINTTLTT